MVSRPHRRRSPLYIKQYQTNFFPGVNNRTTGMKKLLASLWLPLLIGTAAHGLRVENSPKKLLEPELFRNFHHSCKFSYPASSSVHTLTPSDIQVVAAIGSLGNIGASRMHRAGLLQSIQKNLTQTSQKTLTALVRRFNPSVQYYSSLGNSRTDSQMEMSSLLEQAEELTRNMKDSQELDYENNWKLITVFYQYPSWASNSQEASPLNSVKELEEALDFLHEEVPKAFVNLVDSTQLVDLSDPYMDQNNIRAISPDLCSSSNECSTLDDIIRRWAYQDPLEKLLASRRYDKTDYFTVVPQTFLHEADSHLTRNGKAYVDFSKRSSVKITGKEFSALGVELWNNMMQPVGQKQPYHFSEIPKAQCPSQDHPYFFTYRNSNYSFSLVKSDAKEEPEQLSFGTSLPCTDRSPSDTVPLSVHKLRPADIKVIGALGDSLTAANGAAAANLLELLTQYRGLSWSVGGNEDINTITTLANILREFNPSLTGFSTGTGTQEKSNARLNQAVAGARSEALSSQARRLIDLMKNDPEINFQIDWKLITLFIGGNDLCGSCKDTERYAPDNFVSNIQTALDIFHKEVPRLFVNLVTVLHVLPLSELYHEKNVSCPKWLMSRMCSCIVNSDDLDAMEVLNRKYQEGTHSLIGTGRYDTRTDFTVVVQPFMEEADMPYTKDGLPDASFFAPDCFHFHQKSHSQAARALWNNMLEPVGEKLKALVLNDTITLKCPSLDQPYLRTYKNSGYTYPTTPLEAHGSQMLCNEIVPSINSSVSGNRNYLVTNQQRAIIRDQFQ